MASRKLPQRRIKVLTKEILIEGTKEAIAFKYPHTLSNEVLEMLPNKIFPIVYVHASESKVCCEVVLDENQPPVLLDFTWQAYNGLPLIFEDDLDVMKKGLSYVHSLVKFMKEEEKV